MFADRGLRSTPGDSRILRASAGGGCGPRDSESRPYSRNKRIFMHASAAGRLPFRNY